MIGAFVAWLGLEHLRPELLGGAVVRRRWWSVRSAW